MTSGETREPRATRAWAWPLTRRGIAATLVGAGCFVAAALTGARELQYLGLALLALVICAVVLHVIVPPRVDVDRRLEADTVERGLSRHVTVQISSRGRLTGSWRQPLPSGLADAAPADRPSPDAALSRVLGLDETSALPGRAAERGPRGGFEAGEHVQTIEYSVTGVRRGDWSLPPLRLRIDDAFGLARCEVDVGGESPLLVVPSLAPLARTDALGGEPGDSPAQTRQRGQNAENLTPRAYAPGDSVRRVHWRASARRGELMVRQEEREADRDATVLLDRDASRWKTDAGFERAVAAAAAIAWHLAHDGFAVQVVDDLRAPLALVDAPSPEARDHLQRVLARVAPRADGSPQSRRAPSGSVVAIVGSVDDDLARELTLASADDRFVGALVAEVSAEARNTLTRSGWRIARLDDDLAASWSRLVDGPVSDHAGDSRE